MLTLSVDHLGSKYYVYGMYHSSVLVVEVVLVVVRCKLIALL